MPAFESLRAIAAEMVTEEEVRLLVQAAASASASHPSVSPAATPPPAQAKPTVPRAYIGFEPSGTAHVGWMVCTETIRRLTDAGFQVTILLADWHAQINDKLGGDLAAIQRCGRYMEQAFTALGVPRDRVRYVYASELARDPAYWALVVQVLKATTLARMRRAMTIMGRSEDEADGDMSKFLYPAMQVADIFHLGIDLAYGGLDQRHAHMLARDVAPRLGRKPPAALHTHLVPSLKGTGRMDATGLPTAEADQQAFQALLQAELVKGRPEAEAITEAKRRLAERMTIERKMSKSDPTSGIFLHDTKEEIRAKLKAAQCPAKETEGNPVLDLLRLVVWPRLARLHRDGPPRFEIHRPEKFGGSKIYLGWEALVEEYRSGALHPLDLKNGVADALDLLLQPVRQEFARNPADMQFVQALKRTR